MASFDIVGDIAIFQTDISKKEAEALLKEHNNLKVVCKKTKKYSGRYRLPKLKVIAGEKRKETEYKENNARLKLDVEKCYFSPRLANERLRIAKLVKENESVLVMFSGVGVYPLVIAKNSKPKIVYGIEINPIAHKYALENAELNKVGNVKLFKGDVKKVVPKLKKKFDRILMPLPKGGENFLGVALKAAKKGTIMHFYDFLNEKDFNLAKEKIGKACSKAKKKYKILKLVKCGQFGPGIYRVCADFKIM
ncbi:class I SAM-dependent methyltransferase family protein [Candidatus Woesearchaeota archaeon]|nr:class I SAM-dependent methyltransferase family protein [Candidatus Woesearchaeota archaeon]